MLKKTLPLAASILFFSVSNAQTCQSNLPESTIISHFVAQENGTIIDKSTQLLWKRCSEGMIWDSVLSSCTGNPRAFNIENAFAYVQTVNNEGGFANYTDWRIPNIKELASIVDLNCYSPAINLKIFPNTPLAMFWTSTPKVKVSYSGYKWSINFDTGSERTDFYLFNNGHIRLVREKL